MAAFRKFISTFRTAARLLPPPAVEHRVADLRTNSFMTMEKFHNELKYILSVGVALAGAVVVVNRQNVKVEGVLKEVALMGKQVDRLDQREGVLKEVALMGKQVDHLDQRVDRLEEKFNKMEKKMDELLSQQSVHNSWPWSHWRR